jgi:type I restriction-modification system DNA methylase subunit
MLYLIEMIEPQKSHDVCYINASNFKTPNFKKTMPKTNPTAARTIEELKSQYDVLHKRKIQSQTQLETAEKQLQELQSEAKTEFGSSDVAELESKLAEMEAENEKRRSEYQTLLDKIDSELKTVEAESKSEK